MGGWGNLQYVDCVLVYSHAHLFSHLVFLQARLLLFVLHHPPQPSGKCRILMGFTYTFALYTLMYVCLYNVFTGHLNLTRSIRDTENLTRRRRHLISSNNCTHTAQKELK